MEGLCLGCALIAADPQERLCPEALVPIKHAPSGATDLGGAIRSFQCSVCGARWAYYLRLPRWCKVGEADMPLPTIA
jgi:hypothetical protein